MEIKSKNGVATLAGSLIQVRMSLQSYAVAIHVDAKESASLHNNLMYSGIPKVQGPGTNTSKSEVGRFKEDYEMLDYMMLQNYTTYTSTTNTSSSALSSPTASHSHSASLNTFTPTTLPSYSTYTPTSYTPTSTLTPSKSEGDFGPYSGPKVESYTATSSAVKSATVLGTTTTAMTRWE